MKNPPKYTSSAKYCCLEYLKHNSVDLYLNYCGKETCEAGHQYGPAARNEYLLHYILSGEGSFTYGNTTRHLKKHDCFLIIPKENTLYKASLENPWSYVWIGFHGLKALTCLQQAGFSETNRINHFADESEILFCIHKILEAHQLSYAHDLTRQSYLMLLFASMIRQQQAKASSSPKLDYPQQVYVEYAVHFIENNYSKNIKVTDIASYIGINRSYLTTNFTKIMGISPQNYLLNLRMNNSAALLRTTDLPIYQIAAQNGYPNALTFSKTFKSHFGKSPKEYRFSKDNLILADKK